MIKRFDFTSYKNILFAALILRIIAAFFSQGYGMHDDHFLIIEAAGSWVDGFDYNHWLPWSEGNRGAPEGHSFTYVGLNFILISILKTIGIADPKILMLMNRLVHALFSLLIVHFSYKIANRLGGKKIAVQVGWVMALLWVLPFLSVRNLVEITCIPFILWGVWVLLKDEKWQNALYAGLLLGLAVSFRYQVGVFALGIAIVLFFQKKYKPFIWYSIGVLIVFGLTQGLVDYIIWGTPFAEFLGYTLYNMNEGTAYIPNNNYAMYFLVLMGLFLIPLGLLIGIGYFNSAKKYAIIFVPVLLFILFHTFYPSKQERFVLPVFPLFFILGILGIQPLLEKANWQKFWRFSWRTFWVLNIPILLFATFTYSKKSRVESMYYFYDVDLEGKSILQEATGETGVSMLPRFYSGNWYLNAVARGDESQSLKVYENKEYAYILFCGEQDLSARIDAYKTLYPALHLVKVCEPSAIDRLLRWLNPRNTNEYIEIWKIS
ncbi:glycosyltransferase family 39 protein [Crocinitomix catalasitica]|uniref:glycosyltransferase family 39 protein n=1 Tax=Crocinitomix catalasitica TaxID=184607 RepID=UPI000483A683|nr:glycosyltransferase family 39 protein [Crocinitomix catalasitica]